MFTIEGTHGTATRRGTTRRPTARAASCRAARRGKRSTCANTGPPWGGIYSTSVNERTIDEAPSAYKPIEDIIGPIADAFDIIDVMRPIYNFKAS